MSQQSSNDLPVIVGALIVGLLACAVFFFMRSTPTLPPAPEEPRRDPLNPQPVQIVQVDTAGTWKEGAGAPGQVGTAGAGRAPGGGLPSVGAGRERPAIAGG
ncbi:MAG: hypothetical protein K6T17_02305 [Fimbriimonadales bacterium]|jgi:hypothetical protein|nr:hypothetical protein [Fimbriimonadales bacterium]